MRGGDRPGAGRPKGALNKATLARQQIVLRASAEGLSPLEVMLATMHELWDAGDKAGACDIAKHAAPYVHPRLTAIDTDLLRRIEALESASGAKANESPKPN